MFIEFLKYNSCFIVNTVAKKYKLNTLRFVTVAVNQYFTISLNCINIVFDVLKCNVVILLILKSYMTFNIVSI